MYTSPTRPYFSNTRRKVSGDVRYVRLSTFSEVMPSTSGGGLP
uniref:Uncharacterized protein n=1 Tax=Anguilla anguilla TaxID=7936 RepID=A0A0E9W380_ANGAN